MAAGPTVTFSFLDADDGFDKRLEHQEDSPDALNVSTKITTENSTLEDLLDAIQFGRTSILQGLLQAGHNINGIGHVRLFFESFLASHDILDYRNTEDRP